MRTRAAAGELIQKLEAASENDRQAVLFEVFATLTHEMVHYGDYLDGERQSSNDPSGWGGEPGGAFEYEVFLSVDTPIDGKLEPVWQALDIGNVKEAKELMQKHEYTFKKDIIPTLPKL